MASRAAEPSRIQIVKDEILVIAQLGYHGCERVSSTILLRSSQTSSQLDLARMMHSKKMGISLKLLAATLQRVQEELDEATGMRKEAEALQENDMIAECKAAEDGLRVCSYHLIVTSPHSLSFPSVSAIPPK